MFVTLMYTCIVIMVRLKLRDVHWTAPWVLAVTDVCRYERSFTARAKEDGAVTLQHHVCVVVVAYR